MLKHKDIQSEKDINGLIKNYNLLRIVEKIESRKSQLITQQSSCSDKVSIDIKLNTQKLIIDKHISSEKNTFCKQHNLPLLYIGNNKVLLCETCVKASNISYAPIPRVRSIFIERL